MSRHPGEGDCTGSCQGWRGSLSHPTLLHFVPRTLLARGSLSATASRSPAPIPRALVSAHLRQPCPRTGRQCVPTAHPTESPGPAQPLPESKHGTRGCWGCSTPPQTSPGGGIAPAALAPHCTCGSSCSSLKSHPGPSQTGFAAGSECRLGARWCCSRLWKC